VSDEDDIVRASEIGQYAFCARAWWFSRVKGYRPANVAEWSAARPGKSHGRAVQGGGALPGCAPGPGVLRLAALALLAWLGF